MSTNALAHAAGPFEWKTTSSIDARYNGCKGQFVSPFNNWQASDIPPYMQDVDHGYANPDPNATGYYDVNLVADQSERRWLELRLNFTTSPSMAQRLCKIALLRSRFGGTGTFSFDMSAYQMTVLDVIAFNLPLLGWKEKLLEITSFRLTTNKGENGAVLLGTEIDVQETDPSIYSWSIAEELSQEGFQQVGIASTNTAAPPTSVTATSGSAQSVVSADGITSQSRILITWSAPTDGYVTNGGSYQIQYQKVGDSTWTALPSVDGTATQTYINGVEDGAQYNIQIRSMSSTGAISNWTSIGPVTVSGTPSVIQTTSISGDGATSGQVLTYDGTNWIPQSVIQQIPTVIGFVIGNGATGTDIGPMLLAPHAGTISKCLVVVKSSDAATPLELAITQNGTNVFSTNPSITAGTTSGTVSSFGLSAASVNVAANDVFTIDVLQGSSSWQFTAQLE